MAAEVKKQIALEIAHVLFIDVVGYSKLSINEQQAAVDELTQIVRSTEEFQKADASQRLIKIATGDGMALVFYTSPEAPVRCAMELSRVFRDHPRLRLRMGIHSGPVSGVTDVTDRTNLAGAGLNLAQRVMNCGDAGHILLSKHVAEDLGEFEEWRPLLHDLGACEVKHGVRVGVVNLWSDEVGNPRLPQKLQAITKRRARVRWAEVAAALLLLAGTVAAFVLVSKKSARLTSIVPEKSIAVLPFENLSRDPQNAYFAAGIQDEILTRLANLGELKVISRASTEKYSSRPHNLKVVAAELGVATVLEGSVQKLANEVHINVQLINALTDAHIWAQSYDRMFEHVFAVEGEVAQNVADALKVKLLPAQIEKLNALPTQNPKAYDLFLRGEYALDRAWKSGSYEQALKPAISDFHEAIGLDPQFALAFARLAYSELSQYHFGIVDYSATRMPELLASSKQNIDQALHLQPDLAAGHSALGYWHYWGRSNYPFALAEFKHALAIDPRLSEASIGIAAIAMRQGRPNEAIGYLSKELEFDPRNLRLLRQLSESYRMQRDYAKAEELNSRAVALDPTSELEAINLSQCIIMARGDVLAALHVLDPVPAELQQSQVMAEHRYWLLTLARDFAAAEKTIENTPPENWRSDWRRPLLLGDVQRALGRKERARQSFQQARTLLTATTARDREEPLTHADLASVNAELGLVDEALREADRAIELQPVEKDAYRGPQWLVNRAQVNVRLGRTDEAIKRIEEMLLLPLAVASSWDLKLDPIWDPLRNDPRFQKLIALEESKENASK